MLGAFSYNFENKGKYYLHLWSTERQWLIFPFILVIHERILVTSPPHDSIFISFLNEFALTKHQLFQGY